MFVHGILLCLIGYGTLLVASIALDPDSHTFVHQVLQPGTWSTCTLDQRRA